MVEDVSSLEHPYFIDEMHLTGSVRLSGNVTEFFDGFQTPPLLTILKITHSLKEDDDTSEGLTGTIPSSATTWPHLHTLAIEDQNLHGPLPRNLSTFYIPTLNTLAFKNNPLMCGAPPFGGGGRFNEFDGTDIGDKPWDEELQQCVDPPPPPGVEIPIPAPAPAPEPEMMLDVEAPQETPTPAPGLDDGLEDIDEEALVEPVTVPDATVPEPSDAQALAEPTAVPNAEPVFQPEETPDSGSPDSPEMEPEPAEISWSEAEAPTPYLAFSDEICSRQTDPHLLAPAFSRHKEFPVLLSFADLDEASVYCSAAACQLTVDGASLTDTPTETLDETSFVVTLSVEGDGEVQIELSPRHDVQYYCGEEAVNLQTVQRTVVVDTTHPELSCILKTPPTASSSHCALTLVFSEVVQQFKPSSLYLLNAALVSFSGNGTHFDMALVGEHGENASVALSFAGYSDLAGNHGSQDFELIIPVPAAATPVLAGTGSAVVIGTMAATTAVAVTTAVSSGSGAGGGGNFVRAVGHTQFLAMCSSLAVPYLPSDFVALSDGYKWALLSSDENSTQSVERLPTDDATSSRQLLSNATTDWLDSMSSSYGEYTEASQVDDIPQTTLEPAKTRKISSPSSQAFWDKLCTSLGVYALCCAIHFLMVRLIRLFKPLIKLPFILTFPKPQVTVAVMLIPPLIYVGSMVDTEGGKDGIDTLCAFLALPCAIYLIYATFRPTCRWRRPLRRHRISTWEENLEAIEEGASDISSTSESVAKPPVKPASPEAALPSGMTFGKASLSALGRAPTLVLEDDDVDTARNSQRLPRAALATLSHAPTLVLEDAEDDDSIPSSTSDESGEIEREEVNHAALAPTRRRATRWQRKSAIDATTPRPIAEGIETSKPLTKRHSSEVYPSPQVAFVRVPSQAPLLEGLPNERPREASALLAQYGPLFDDVIGSEDAQAERYATLPCLLSVVLYFLCRVLSAALFGIYSQEIASHVQVRLLLALHSLYLAYLAGVRPYSNRSLMITELICHFCEWSILLTALILSERGSTFQVASSLLLTLAYIDIGTLTLYECLRMVKYIRQAYLSRTTP